MAEAEKFIRRWSRLKRAAAAAPVPAGSAAPTPVELPPIDLLGFDSDFTAFLQAKVDEKLKQAALKKLFHSPQFNRMDGLDVYIDDYNSFEPIPEEMLRRLNHAQDLLFRKDEQQAEVATAQDDPADQVATNALPDERAVVEAADPEVREVSPEQSARLGPESDNPR